MIHRKDSVVIIRYIILFTFILFKNFGIAQNGYFDYKIIRKEDLSFPVFYSNHDSLSIEKINQHLQLSELEQLKGLEKSDIFEAVTLDDRGIYGGRVKIAPVIITNTDKCLSIKIKNSSCGATCAYWVNYYNFNPKNGDRILLPDLFTSQGFKSFRKYLTSKKVNILKKELLVLDSLQRAQWSDVIPCYQEDNLYDFYIKSGAIFIDGYNCLHKNLKFSDIKVVVKFDVDEFESYLNDYGKSFFGLSNIDIVPFHSQYLPQLFEGKINDSYDIVLLLRPEYQQEVEGIYAYKKYGKGIYLEGILEKDILKLTEYSSNTEENAKIDALYTNEKIVGSWKSKSKTYSFTAKKK